jgi:hypothetical protein
MPNLPGRRTRLSLSQRSPFNRLRLPAVLVGMILLGGCMSKEQFAGSFARDTQSYFDDHALYRLESRAYQQFRYDFWGEHFEGVRVHYGVQSKVNYPLCVTLRVPRQGLGHTVYINDGTEYRIEPGQTAWVGDLLFSPTTRNLQSATTLEHRRC